MSNLEIIHPGILYCLFKGEPGTRKSTQALSFPKPQYWFSWDGKMESILVPARKWGMEIPDFKDYDDWDSARKQLEAFQIKCPYKTLVIDSLTSCADTMLRRTRKARQHRTVAGVELHDIEDFNVESSGLAELMALTKDIKKYHKINIILIAHVLNVEYKNLNNQTNVSRTIVTAAKKVAAKIPAYCAEVYHFDIKQGMKENEVGKYRIITESTGDDFARTALDLDREIVFEDKPLYDGWLLPAINKLRENPVVVNSLSPIMKNMKG